jgi:hypothetical protein
MPSVDIISSQSIPGALETSEQRQAGRQAVRHAQF